ncbi:hypothetical protein PF005_g32105 [Phytophthora fragariae]|uniref:RxLR effector protein n=1 Tax=Phytophthora fragariae TaxID=53985 RepID=A0A6A3PCG8_9STRA|nr:hypothetical protein PF003_g36491 [Phytophthora fragariae]KAE8879398.1 hypothetical protein PF003_g36501 [Phytophthora fragariae]KAE8917564.1 hypothetical protein PF009_g32115 [Phytophthora fragariae]KAE8956405.1 hypothetical protein PF011_g31490 [Phytophthora fragariae]KAE9056832.1 hypothetical protein PF010_g31609 [Phytophthora fragariae]
MYNVLYMQFFLVVTLKRVSLLTKCTCITVINTSGDRKASSTTESATARSTW